MPEQMYNFYLKKLMQPPGCARPVVLVIRMTLVILITAILQVNAKTYAQTVTLSENNVSLSSIFEKISKQTGYDFIVSTDNLKIAKNVTVHVYKQRLPVVLSEIFSEQPLAFLIQDSTIVVSQKEIPVMNQKTKLRSGLKQITGKVIDTTGKPLAHASVKIKGKNEIVFTGQDGTFLIEAQDGDVLEVSFVGFNTYMFKVTKGISYENIILHASTSTLDEIRIIGYGTTTQRLTTGSISSINSATIEKQPVANVLSALSGQVPGLYVQTNNGLPGGDISIQIRGPGSFSASNNPLYVIDGVPFISTSLATADLASGLNGSISPFNSLNPNDIQSISILKDADATAIYGSRGANGVVLITTKKGKKGSVKTDLNVSNGVSKVADQPKLLDLKDYLAIRREAFKNDALTPSADPNSSDYAPDLTVWSQTKSTDWAKYIMGGTGHTNNIQATISGGSEQTDFSIGANYRAETTVLPGNNEYIRGGIHTNIQHSSFDHKFNVSMSTSYSQDNNQLVNVGLGILLPPNFPIYNADGSYNFLNGYNPVAATNNSTNSQSSNIITNAQIIYEIIPGLQLKASAGLNNLNLKQTLIYPSAAQDPTQQPVSTTYFGNNSNQTFIIEPQVNYSLKIKRSSIDILLGGTWEKTENDGEEIIASNFNSEHELQNLSSAATIQPRNTDITYKYASVFGRITYNWNDKYLLNASMRRDGSSKFGPGNQYGTFGAVGAAWLFSEEQFLKKINWLSFGKLRVSYGITGNDQIPAYQFLPTYGTSGIIYQNIAGLTPTQIANPDLKWETTKKFNAGLDLSFVKDRIVVSIDRFIDRSSNQLTSFALPDLTGFSYYEANLPAVVQNQGWEFQVTTKNVKKPNFRWSTTFNFTASKNTLESFPGLASSSYADIYIIGQSILRTYGFKLAAIDPQSGTDLYAVKGGGTSSTPDFNNIFFTEGDMNPAFYGGFNNSFIYKSFQFDLFTQFAKHNLQGGLYETPGLMSNNFQLIVKRWQQPGDMTSIPKATTNPNDYYFGVSSANFFNASYFRIKSATISYTFPDQWMKSIKIDKLRIYAQGQNLWTFWNRNTALYDPENGVNGVPPLRSVIIGFQITL